MKKAGVAAFVLASVILALLPIGCGGTTQSEAKWVTVAKLENPTVLNADVTSLATPPFQLTGAPCRLRWENKHGSALSLYLVSRKDSANRQLLYELQAQPNAGEVVVSAKPGDYELEVENPNAGNWHFWLEEQR